MVESQELFVVVFEVFGLFGDARNSRRVLESRAYIGNSRTSLGDVLFNLVEITDFGETLCFLLLIEIV